MSGSYRPIAYWLLKKTHQAGALYMVAVRASGTKAVAWLDWYMVRAAMQSSLSIFWGDCQDDMMSDLTRGWNGLPVRLIVIIIRVMMLSADVSCRIFTRIFFFLVMSQRSSRGFPLMHMIWNWRVSLWLVGSLHPKDIPKTWRWLCFLRLVDVKPSVVGCGQRMAGRVRFNCFIRIPFTVLLSLFP